MISLKKFVAESNRIEGIDDVSRKDMEAHENLLARPHLAVRDIEQFVSLVQPNAILRRPVGLNVRVGNHIAPAGGPKIEPALEAILKSANNLMDSPAKLGFDVSYGAYVTHLDYEDLHPFSDGNGRSGRAIWLWMRRGLTGRGFLYEWNKQVLSFGDLGFEVLRARYYSSLRAVKEPKRG